MFKSVKYHMEYSYRIDNKIKRTVSTDIIKKAIYKFRKPHPLNTKYYIPTPSPVTRIRHSIARHIKG